MRLFIAAELPFELRTALAETSALLRDAIRGRYVGTDSFHVTLAFLGSVETARVNAAIAALEEGCAGHSPIDARLGELGSFGKRSSATLWQGFEDETELRSLAEDVRDALEQAGFEFDRKAFKAHVTLMRKADITSGIVPTAPTSAGSIDTVTLFRSDLSGERPHYEPLHRVTLTQVKHSRENDGAGYRNDSLTGRL